MLQTDRQLSSGMRRLTASAFAGMFVFGIVMAILGAILPSLFARISMGKAEAGNLFLIMNFAMLVMSLLFGPVVDRFGFKVFLVLCSLLVAVAFGLLAAASSYGLIVLAVVVLGFGGGGLNGGTNALTSDINPGGRGSALNLLGIFFGFGALSIPFLIGRSEERRVGKECDR
jgi:FHS family glucose/mannose:H+ symporter-like MFS transporter